MGWHSAQVGRQGIGRPEVERVSNPSSSQRLTTGLPEVGPWARDKLDALARYLEFYTKVLKNQRWRTLYLDAYAGGGRAVVRTGDRPPASGADLFSDGFQLGLRSRSDDDIRACLGECQRDGRTEAAAATGDDGDLVV